jgi:hypothetical protein
VKSSQARSRRHSLPSSSEISARARAASRRAAPLDSFLRRSPPPPAVRQVAARSAPPTGRAPPPGVRRHSLLSCVVHRPHPPCVRWRRGRLRRQGARRLPVCGATRLCPTLFTAPTRRAAGGGEVGFADRARAAFRRAAPLDLSLPPSPPPPAVRQVAARSAPPIGRAPPLGVRRHPTSISYLHRPTRRAAGGGEPSPAVLQVVLRSASLVGVCHLRAIHIHSIIRIGGCSATQTARVVTRPAFALWAADMVLRRPHSLLCVLNPFSQNPPDRPSPPGSGTG